MAVVDTQAHDDHHHHDHGEFIAHHFDNAEQQFDSGKLGIWLFLVTEVLFFSGLFVAYTLYRNHHPEIFDQAHVYLDKILGGLNTVVLLFSSLTMALGVRAAQLGKNKNCGVYVLITMVCAAVFIGVKAVEYSHKWDMGILVRSAFDFTSVHPEQTMITGLSDYLVMLSVIPLLLLVGFAAASAICKLTDKPNLSKFMLGLTITVGGYFLGAVGGYLYMEATGGGTGGGHGSVISSEEPIALYAITQDEEHAGDEKAHDKAGAEHKDGEHKDGDHAHEDEHAAGDHKHHDDEHGHGAHAEPEFDRDVGIFFSIYYCMTGLHAIHIIGGIVALSWIYWRCLQGHWRSDYFGPVDYVGLYWHLVDLIWIYLFPLLYLID